MTYRLRVFQHVPHEGLGSLEAVFAARGLAPEHTRFYQSDPLPAIADFDMLVVLGGPMNVYEHARHPWLAAETALIREALHAGKAVLGLCLGAQLMAVALDGRVTRNAEREVGWWNVEMFPGGEDDLRAACFPPRFKTFHWHGDTFSIPPGATPLFRSEACAHQGFAWGARAVALQFHPEITAAALEQWIEVALADGGGDLAPGPYVQSADAMRRDAAHVVDNNRWMDSLCATLISKA